MNPAARISIYAELLPNIRQVSVGAAFPSPADATTSAEVVDGGRCLRISHHGRAETVELPATATASAALAVPRSTGSDLGWRLPVSTAEASALRSAPEGQAVPWTSVDVKPGSSISCRECGAVLVPSGQIKTWKDLPSENWAEIMEFWHCHKPHDHGGHEDKGLADRGYGANNTITARPRVGLVEVTLFMLCEVDCDNLLVSLDEDLAISTRASPCHRPQGKEKVARPALGAMFWSCHRYNPPKATTMTVPCPWAVSSR